MSERTTARWVVTSTCPSYGSSTYNRRLSAVHCIPAVARASPTDTDSNDPGTNVLFSNMTMMASLKPQPSTRLRLRQENCPRCPSGRLPSSRRPDAPHGVGASVCSVYGGRPVGGGSRFPTDPPT